MLVMRIRIPSVNLLETVMGYETREERRRERGRKKKETLGCLGALAYALDITQVALNDYDTGTL